MNILILGNGFDIAHKLPTKYTDFLAFSKKLLCVYTWHGNLREYIDQHIKTWNDGHEYLKEQLENIFKRRQDKTIRTGELGLYDFIVNIDDKIDAFRDHLANNIWFNYISEIYKDNLVRGENWIDFESEISFVIQALDRKFESLEDRFTIEILKRDLNTESSSNKQSKFCDCYRRAKNEAIRKARKENPEKKITDIGPGTLFSLRHLRDRLYDDLEHLILAFEFYLTEFVEKIPVKKLSFVDEIDPSYILTFNYTKTFERLYTYIYSSDRVLPHVARICHVHGECKGENEDENREKSCREESGEEVTENTRENARETDRDNDMVIGIDEYWETPEDQSKRTNFAIFKKFIQRIRKRNKIDYVDWAEEADSRYKNRHDDFSNVYIFGHSLDVTDKDILKKFLSTDATYIHIFAKDKGSEGALISNLLMLIGREAIMRKSAAGKIRFHSIKGKRHIIRSPLYGGTFTN